MDEKKDAKPFPLVMADFKNNLINTINTSGLPVCVIREILLNLYREIDTKATLELTMIQEKQS